MNHPIAHGLKTTLTFPKKTTLFIAWIICLILLALVNPFPVQAARQELGGVESEGNLRIRVDDTGQMGVERYVGGNWESQIFGGSPGMKGSKLYADETMISLGYYDQNAESADLQSNILSGNTITTKWSTTNFEITQETTYTNGNAFYRLEWTITNIGVSTVNDLRFFHGEDTYLLGDDKGGGFWDETNHAIGVKKLDDGGVEQRMTLQGVTIPYAYDSDNFGTVSNNAIANALKNTINEDVSTDNGYALEWRTASLAPGASWSIVAFEKFNDAAATGLSVTAPVSIDCDAGTTCEMNFSVQNVGESSASVDLSLSDGPSWGETIVSPSSPVNIAAGATQAVTVQVSVPAGAAGGTTTSVTLNASDGTNTSSDTGGIYVPVPPAVAPTTFTSGALADGTFGVAYSHTFAADGSPAPTYSVLYYALPSGLSLNSSTGLLSGTPSAAGRFSFTLYATNEGGAHSQVFHLNVAKAGTTTLITSISPESSVYGQNYTVSVSVTSATIGTPGGTVLVSDGTNDCTVSLSGGTGSCMLPSSSAGNKTLTATCGSTTYFEGSSTTATHLVNKADTVTLATQSVADPVYGEPLHFTANVVSSPPSSGTPTGPVQFYLDGEAFGSPVMLSDGTATSQTTTALSIGEHTYHAVYLGDANNNGSDSLPAVTFEIAQNETTTTVTSSSPTSVYGQPVSLMATVAAVSPSVVTPVGQVQFYFENEAGERVALGAPVNLVDGQAVSTGLDTLLGAHPLVGAYTYSAEYLGSANSLPSVSVVETQTVEPAAASVTVSTVSNPSVYGEFLPVTITVDQEVASLVRPAGQVQLYLNGVKFGSPLTLDGGGQAHRNIPEVNIWPGEHEMTATYTPVEPAQFLPGDNLSAPHLQTVNKADPVIDFQVMWPEQAAFEPIDLAVLVKPTLQTQGIPGGTVQFTVDGNPIEGPIALDAGGWAQTAEALFWAAGDHVVIVSYSGNDYFNAVPSTPEYLHTVAKAETNVTIDWASPTEVVVGQTVDVQVQVSPFNSMVVMPDGTVTVSNGTDSCDATLDETGLGRCFLTPTSTGSPELTAHYNGSDDFEPSDSVPVAGPVVSRAVTTIVSVSLSPANPNVGQSMTVAVKVAPVAPGWGSPGGTVRISASSGQSCEATLAEGEGSCSLSFDQVGPVMFDVDYAGDANFLPAHWDLPGVVMVTPAETTLVLAPSLPSVYGEPVRFTANISVDAPGAGSPTGEVQFRFDGVDWGDPVALVDGAAESAPISDLPVGDRLITVVYLGEADFLPTTSPALTHTVTQVDSSLVLSSSQNPSPYGVPVLITAHLAGAGSSQAVPTGGMVQFFVDGVAYGEPATVGPEGTADKLLPYTALWVGSHELTASFSGDESFIGSDNLAEPFVQEVGKGELTILVDYDVELPAYYGQAVTVTATVEGEGHNKPRPSGTLQFALDGTPAGDPVELDALAQADSPALTGLAVGDHALSMSYSGDDYYQAYTLEVPAAITVARAPTSVRFTNISPISPVVVGQPVTISFTVDVDTPESGSPTGTVTLGDAGHTCTGDLATGSCIWYPSRYGVASLTASYSGDGQYTGAVLAEYVGPMIQKAAVALAIDPASLQPDSVVVGQPFSVSAQVMPVDPGIFVPVGATVVITNDIDSCQATIQADGSATCSLTPTTAAELDLTASLAETAGFLGATAVAVPGPTVEPASILVGVTTSANPALVGASVRFTAAVQVAAPGAGTPTGSVQFVLDGADWGDPVALVDGQAESPMVSDLAAGDHTISARYLGSDAYQPGSALGITQKIVAGSLGEVTPEEGGTFQYAGQHNGLPVTTTIQVPAGAVDEAVRLVFTPLETSPVPLEAGQELVLPFTLRAYVDGELQPGYSFAQAITLTLGYNPDGWDERSFDVAGWNGSQWSPVSLTPPEQDLVAHTLTISLDQLGHELFALTGEPQFRAWLPLIGR